MSNHEKITFTFQWQEAGWVDMARDISANVLSKPLALKYSLIIGLVIAILLADACYSSDQQIAALAKLFLPFLGALAVLLAIFFYAIVPRLRDSVFRKKFQSLPVLSMEQEWHITDKAVKVKMGGKPSEIAWGEVKGVKLLRSGVWLELASGSNLLVPRLGLEQSGHYDHFISMLATRGLLAKK